MKKSEFKKKLLDLLNTNDNDISLGQEESFKTMLALAEDIRQFDPEAGFSFSIEKSEDQKTYLLLSSDNGQPVLSGETYTQKHNAKELHESLENAFAAGEIKFIDNTKD